MMQKSGKTAPCGATGKEVTMAKATLREIKATLESIADGVLLNPASEDAAFWAERIKEIVPTLETFRSVKIEASVTASAFEKMGDTFTAELLEDAIATVR
jgi:hypothetical protein